MRSYRSVIRFVGAHAALPDPPASDDQTDQAYVEQMALAWNAQMKEGQAIDRSYAQGARDAYLSILKRLLARRKSGLTARTETPASIAGHQDDWLMSKEVID